MKLFGTTYMKLIHTFSWNYYSTVYDHKNTIYLDTLKNTCTVHINHHHHHIFLILLNIPPPQTE